MFLIYSTNSIIRTKLRTKFHEDLTINVTSRVLTRKTVPTNGVHFLQWTGTIFKLSLTINKNKYLTIKVTFRVLTRKTAPQPDGHFHEDWTKNKTSSVLTRTNVLTKFHDDLTINVTPRLNCPAPSRPYIITNVLTKFHEDWTYNKTSRVLTRKTAPPPGGHTNVLTKFPENWKLKVTSRVLTSFFFNLTYFELDHNIIGTYLLTKFHEDQTINVASIVLTMQNVDDGRQSTHDGHKAITKAHHEHVVLR
ncbi:hypothetical protein DPMN_058984 [Dreissena polymorpha]|uniref:Uncharacterized protein n=1 Tax=Dreissena polymorpha TaxID=45954 RepID=A0A9D4C347_DREPO|nr:hypothetical protein DPMN_058984 [Dreissena polymorpha]